MNPSVPYNTLFEGIRDIDSFDVKLTKFLNLLVILTPISLRLTWKQAGRFCSVQKQINRTSTHVEILKNKEDPSNTYIKAFAKLFGKKCGAKRY